MTNLSVFSNQQFGKIRIIEDNGKMLFCGSDIAKSLQYKNTSKAIKDHCRCVTKRYIPHPQNPNKQIEVNFISEGDIYRLISNSELPTAEQFESWVFDEVLPQIRQTGGYVQSEREFEFIQKYFPSFTEDTKLSMFKDLHEQNQEFKSQIKMLTPQAEAYQDLMTAEGYIKFIDLAQMIEIGRSKLFEFLRKEKVLTKQSNFNVPYGRFTQNGYFKVIQGKDSKGHYNVITMVSPKGVNYIYKLIKKKHLENEFNTNKLLSSSKLERTVA